MKTISPFCLGPRQKKMSLLSRSYSPSSTLLLCAHSRYNLFAHSLALHTLSHCTSYSLFFFSLFVSYFIFTIFIYIYIYILSRVLFHSFYCFYVIFILLLLFFIFLHFLLSGPVLTNISLLIIPCMIVYVTNNKEP